MLIFKLVICKVYQDASYFLSLLAGITSCTAFLPLFVLFLKAVLQHCWWGEACQRSFLQVDAEKRPVV